MIPAALKAEEPIIKRALGRLVPQRIMKEQAIVRRTYPNARAEYIKLRAFAMLGFPANARTYIPRDAQRFLFVCFGNIMRSPMAEALFRKFTDQQHIAVTVASAGLHAIDGRVADPRACSSAREFGISLTKHRSRRLSAEMMSQADVVFIMDFQNQAELKARYPFFEEKVRSLAIFADRQISGREIPDPYYGDSAATRNCCAVLANCVQNLVEKLELTRS